MPHYFPFFPVGVLFATFCSISWAETTPSEKPNEQIVRLYKVDDLLGSIEIPLAPPGFERALAAKPNISKDNAKVGLVDLIKTVVDPDSWEEDRTLITWKGERLFVAQSPSVHAEIYDLLTQLRKLNDIQIGFQIEVIPIPSVSSVAFGEVSMKREYCATFNGQEGVLEFDSHMAHLVRLTPISALPVEPELERQNEPFVLVVPEGKSLRYTGVVSQNQDTILIDVRIGNEKDNTHRSFHASPFLKR